MNSIHFGQLKSGSWLLEASEHENGGDDLIVDFWRWCEENNTHPDQVTLEQFANERNLSYDDIYGLAGFLQDVVDPDIQIHGTRLAYSDAAPFAGTFGTPFSSGSGGQWAVSHPPGAQWGGATPGGSGGASSMPSLSSGPGSSPISGAGASPPANYSPSSGVEQWRSNVETGLQRNNLPTSPDYVNRVLHQMQSESSGNPTAINNTDSNAVAGHPSQGLMQTIPSTFQQYHLPGDSDVITDPQANIDSAIGYAKSTYGPTLMNSQGKGIGSEHGYDQGGWLPPGHTHVVNNTGEPELVIPMRMLPHIFKDDSIHAGQYKSGSWLLEASDTDTDVLPSMLTEGERDKKRQQQGIPVIEEGDLYTARRWYV